MSIKSPVTIELALTHDCNHRCVHCYNPDRTAPISVSLSDDVFNDRVDSIIEDLIKNEVFKVIITGGEPLTHPKRTIDIVKKLSDNNIFCSINTNSTLLTETFLERIAMVKKAPSLFISLPSYNESECDHITQTVGSFQKIHDSIEMCDKYHLNVGINTVYSKLVGLDYADIDCFLKCHPNINYVSISPAVPPEYSLSRPDFNVDSAMMNKLTRTLLWIKQNYKMPVGSTIPLPLCIVGFDSVLHNGTSMCSAGRTHCTIDVELGKIFACAQSFSEGFDLNLGIQNAWAQMGKWRDKTLLHPTCVDCPALSLCSGLCRKYDYQHLPFTPKHIIISSNSLEHNEIKLIDKTYIFNSDTRLRSENFGGTVFIYNKYFFLAPAAYTLVQHMSKMEKFTLSDIKELVTYNDAFKKLFFELIEAEVIT